MSSLIITQLNDEYAIAQLDIPSKYVGHSLQSINIENRFNLKPVATLFAPKEKVVSTLFTQNLKVDLSCDEETIFTEKDIVVVAGRLNDIKRFIES